MEHLTQNTIYQEYSDWCTRCRRFTPHRRTPGQRAGLCTEVHQPSAKQLANERRHANAVASQRQRQLFGGHQ